MKTQNNISTDSIRLSLQLWVLILVLLQRFSSDLYLIFGGVKRL